MITKDDVKGFLRKIKRQRRANRHTGTEAASLYSILRNEKIVRAQQGLACATILKDEAPYLEEWIEFHVLVGFEHFYIYDNGSTDGTLDVLAPYIRKNIVTVIPWKNFSGKLHPQKAANAHAVANFADACRWMAFFDVDEFLFSPTHKTLLEPLEKLGDQICVSVPWQNFGTNGHKTAPDGLVIENYTEKAEFPPLPAQRSLLRYKTILDPTRVSAAGTHAFHYVDSGPMLMNVKGTRAAPAEFEDREFAIANDFQLNHYFTRSEEELENKRQKGRVSSKGDKVIDFVDNRLKQYALSTCTDIKILTFVGDLKNVMMHKR